VTGGFDCTARLWPFQVEDLIDLARITVGRNFTAEEWKLYFPGEPYRKTFPDLPGLPPPKSSRGKPCHQPQSIGLMRGGLAGVDFAEATKGEPEAIMGV
jgi:hypothetical protein